LATRAVTFPPTAIHDVRVVKQGGKSASYALALIDSRGAETTLLRGSGNADLGEVLTKTRDFFVERRGDELHLVESNPLQLLAIAAALAAVAALLVRSGIRGRFSRRLRIDRSRIAMRDRSIEVPAPLTAIEIETGTIHDAWKSRGQADEVGGRVVLVGERERVALTDDLLPGANVHEQLATELREIFGLAPKSQPTAAAPMTSFAAYKPILAMFAFATIASIVGNLVLRARANKSEGTLEVTCTNRCKFQGMECMPGGSLGSTLKPGDYAFEVFDASSPTQWTTRTVTIEVGKTTRFACTPR
jgi:hypothetical protein